MAEEQISKEAIPEKEGVEAVSVEELKERLERIKPKIEKEKGAEEKERIIKQEIKSYLQDLQKTPSFAPSVKTRDEVKEISKFPPSQQIGSLISLVFEKGLKEAISVAGSLDNPAILDEFHDTLVDRYYEELIKKKILKAL